ncbi:MAG TPA: methyl-accepting chemotaxis protein [Bryobacteraceae bacterium]|nr:methyl-accepting chemotaxis protein [Bryobacteraceae bacterium]
MTIGKKLTLCFAGLAALLLVLSYSSLSSLANMKERFDETADKTAKAMMIASATDTAQSDMMLWQRGVLLNYYAKDQAGAQAAAQRFHEYSEKVARGLEELQPLLTRDDSRRLIDQIRAQHQQWLTAYPEMERLCASGDLDGAVGAATVKIVPLYNSMSANLGQLVSFGKERLELDRKAAADANSSGRWIAFVLIALAMVLGAVALYTVRDISKTLTSIAGGMLEGSEQVASAASQVSTSSQGLAQGASEQAASLQETSSSSEEIHSMTRKNAENSQTAAKLMDDAAREVENANGKLDLMVSSMKEINTSSDKISKIIKVIDEIAFQTNILALNAAVEAARAGEAGMGFAVVADEVRNLAQRCAQAAKDTAGMIEDSIAKSTEGSSRLGEVAVAIHSITENAQKVKTLIDEVNLGSQEQARGIEQVAKAIAQMEQVTQKTAANAEESASAGEELSAQSQTLRDMVERLTALVDGARAGNGYKQRPQRSLGTRRQERVASSAGLAALGKAVARRTGTVAETRQPAMAAARNEFPMDEDFKDF